MLEEILLNSSKDASFFKAFHHLVLKVLPRVGKVTDSSAMIM